MPYRIIDKCIGCSVCKKICPANAIVGKRGKVHEVVPDRCIDCGACGRVCPQEAVLDEKGRMCERMRFRSRWEKPVFDNEKCISCTVCIESCPTACLSLWFTRDHENTRGYPILKKERDCIACGICVSECPVDAVKMVAPSSA